MLVHSRTLYHLYPEQMWLDNLQATEKPAPNKTAASSPQRRPRKASRTTANLRKLEGIEKQPSVLGHIKDFLEMYSAA